MLGVGGALKVPKNNRLEHSASIWIIKIHCISVNIVAGDEER